MVPASLSTLQAGQAVLTERLDNLGKNFQETTGRIVRDVNDKHLENRKGRHEIRNDLQEVKDDIWRLKLKVALYAGGGSAIVSGITELIKLIFHH